jgi:hypothetical protein
MLWRVIWLAILAGAGWYTWKSGIYYSVTHSGEPEIGRICRICGLSGEGVYCAADQENLKYAIDATIGTPGQRLESAASLVAVVNQGRLVKVADNTQVRVLENDKLSVLGFSYGVAKLEFIDGDYAGSSGWVLREDVVDTPIQEVVRQATRWGGKMTNRDQSRTPAGGFSTGSE